MAFKIPLVRVIGVLLLLIGLMLYMAGVKTPVWFNMEEMSSDGRLIKTRIYAGLWEICKYSATGDKGPATPCINPRKMTSELFADYGFIEREVWMMTEVGAFQDRLDAFANSILVVRAMAVLGVLSGLVALLAALVLLFDGERLRNLLRRILGNKANKAFALFKLFPVFSFVATFVSCVFFMTGVVIWGFDIHDHHVGYSIVLVLLGENLMLCGGLVTYFAYRPNTNTVVPVVPATSGMLGWSYMPGGDAGTKTDAAAVAPPDSVHSEASMSSAIWNTLFFKSVESSVE